MQNMEENTGAGLPQESSFSDNEQKLLVDFFDTLLQWDIEDEQTSENDKKIQTTL